jgi:hypothetical protein
MPRMGTGPVVQVPVPANLRKYFTVTSFTETLHGRGRGHKAHRKKPSRHLLHGQPRHPDVWHGKGAIHQG